MLKWLLRWFRSSAADNATVATAIHSAAPASSFWATVGGSSLAQGDYLRRCFVPIVRPDFAPQIEASEQQQEVGQVDLIIVTQSCDLENNKAAFVALCPISNSAKFELQNPKFAKKSQWEEVRKGRVEGLHLLASPTNPANNRDALVVDFRQIFSLPVAYLSRHAESLGDRWRLQSPFLEHFSQAFARFFMRVGLPSAIPPYK